MNSSSRQRGQALAEHGLLIALMVVLVISSLSFFSASATGLFSSINNAIAGSNGGSAPSGGTPTSSPTDGGSGGSLIISDAAPTAGQILTLTGSGFKPSSPVQAVLHSDTIVLKTQNADTSGAITMEVRIPPTIDLGHHTITLEGQNAANTPITVSSQPLTITANPVSVSAQTNSGPLYSGNYSTAAYIFAASGAGGVGNLTYSWTGPDSFSASGLTSAYSFSCLDLPATVTFTVTDGQRHQADISIPLAACADPVLGSLTAPLPSLVGTNAVYSLGSVPLGGQGSYHYQWTTNVSGATWTPTDSSSNASPTLKVPNSNLNANSTVSLQVTDDNGQISSLQSRSLPSYPALLITVTPSTKTYGAGNPNFAVTYSGFTDGDSAANLGGSLSYTTSATISSAVGDYSVTASGKTSTKYEIVYVDGMLTINQANLTIKANAGQSKVLGTSDPTLTYTLTAGTLLFGDQLTGTLSRDAGETAGAYAINQNTLSAGSNYLITYTSDSFVINAPVSPTFIAQSVFVSPTGRENAAVLTMPAGVQPGDLLLMTVAEASNARNFTTPTGWTADCAACHPGMYAAKPSYGFYSRIATTADIAGTTYTVSDATIQYYAGTLTVYRNATIKSVTGFYAASAATTDTATAISGAPANSLIVVAGARPSGVTSLTTSPNTMVQRALAATHVSAYVFDYALPGGGNLSAPTLTAAPSSSQIYANVTYVLASS